MESLWNPSGTTREQYRSNPRATRQQHAFPAPADAGKAASLPAVGVVLLWLKPTGRREAGWRLLLRTSRCIHLCMPNVLTVRLPSSLLAKVDRKAAALGRARAEHVRQVLEQDVAAGVPKPRRFACLSLKGRYALGGGSDNVAVRRALARRA